MEYTPENDPLPSLEEFYSQFGTDCVREIQRQVMLHAGLENFLRRLGIPLLGGQREHRIALRTFVHQYGVGFFLRAAKANFDPVVLEQMKNERLIELAKPRKPPPAAAFMAPAKAGKNGKTPKAAAAPPAQESDKPEPPRADQGATAAATGEKWITTPTYCGPDRRHQPDRRQATHDRRQQLEPILFDNRRFGGDRRKYARRQEDRERLAGLEEPSPRAAPGGAQAPEPGVHDTQRRTAYVRAQAAETRAQRRPEGKGPTPAQAAETRPCEPAKPGSYACAQGHSPTAAKHSSGSATQTQARPTRPEEPVAARPAASWVYHVKPGRKEDL